MDPTGSKGGRYFSGQLLELPERSAEKSRGKKEKNGIFPPYSNSCCFIDKLAVYNKIVILS